MKKRFVAILSLIAALTLIFVGCSDDSAPEGFKNVANENDAFFLYVPTTWVSNTAGGTASAYYSSSDTSNVSMTCMLMSSELMSLDDYSTKSVESLSAVLPNFTLVEKTEISSESTTATDSTTSSPDGTASPASESESTTTADETTSAPSDDTSAEETIKTTEKLGGYDAIRFEYTATLEGKTYHYLQVVAVKSDMFYLLTYTALEENFANHLPEVNAIIGYVTFK